MEPSAVRRAVEAASAVTSTLGLRVDDAVVVNDSDRIAVRLLPCDVLARVAPAAHAASAQFEVEIARRLAATGAPVAELEPRVDPGVHRRDGSAVTLWTYYEPTVAAIAPADFAEALLRLHAGYRQIDLTAPHFTDRVAEAEDIVGDPRQSRELADADRELLRGALRHLTASITERGRDEQLLHGEPHPGNLLATEQGPLFIDLETCCRGPVEFDIAHGPDDLAAHYPGADHEVVNLCRVLMWAMVTSWRWRDDDQFPDRAHWRIEGLHQLREALARRPEF